MQRTIAIIGFGLMGESLIRGILNADRTPCADISAVCVFEKSAERQKYIRQNFHTVNNEYSNTSRSSIESELARHREKLTAITILRSEKDQRMENTTINQSNELHANLVILAVKPQDFSKTIAEYREVLSNTPIISIAAGVSIVQIEQILPNSPIIRFMPSIAASVKKSYTAVAFSDKVGEEFKHIALGIASAIGEYIEIDESLFHAIIGLSGSGIAFAYEFIHSLALAGIQEGLRYDQSLNAVCAMLEGALATIREGSSPENLIAMVCSPAGTTIEGIRRLKRSGFGGMLMEAIRATVDRSREIEESRACDAKQ